MGTKRLTKGERRAIVAALAQALAGPLDGYDEDSAEADRIHRDMQTALDKLAEDED